MGRIDRATARVPAHRAPKSRTELAAALADARDYTLRCYAHLSAADPVFPCIPVVNPARWELGHIGWFQEYWCRRHRPHAPPRAPADCGTPSRVAGADAMWDSARVPHDDRWSLPLPGWREIERYLDATLADTQEALARSRDGERECFELALLHEDMHGEALLMTLQTLGLPPPAGMPEPPVVPASGPSGDRELPGGEFDIGSRAVDACSRFVFDNECGAHPVRVEPFAIACACVTEGEFAAFVDEGGYAREDFWTGEGRRWLAQAGRTMPACWRRGVGRYEVRWFDRWRALSPGTAVQHVNAHEAEAWCRWAGRRLPTEAEWEVAAAGLVAGDECAAVLDGRTGGPTAAASRDGGAAHVIGNVWEWTSSPFLAYPGFAAGPYAEYSQPWFGDHRVLRGGSWATRSRLVHPRFRNFYLPSRSDVFAGFRTCAPR